METLLRNYFWEARVQEKTRIREMNSPVSHAHKDIKLWELIDMKNSWNLKALIILGMSLFFRVMLKMCVIQSVFKSTVKFKCLPPMMVFHMSRPNTKFLCIEVLFCCIRIGHSLSWFPLFRTDKIIWFFPDYPVFFNILSILANNIQFT